MVTIRHAIRGLTFVEMLIAAAVILTVLAGVATLLLRAWANHDALLTQNLVQQQARAALDMVIDEVRTLNPWDPSTVIATQNTYGAQIGTSFALIQRNAQNQLTRGPLSRPPLSIINNITAFQIEYELRQRQDDGSIVWRQVSDIHNDPTLGSSAYDPRIADVVTLYVRVTAQRPSPLTGVVYSSTLSSAVKIRNQFYDIAPPEG
jgi:hypothetical protein